MKRNFHIAVGILWVAPVVLLLQYGLVWDRLPMKLATHFVANGQPNGWMSREMAAAFPVLILLPILLVATLVLARIRNPEGGAWAILGVFYVVSGIMVFANQQILAFNLHGDQVQVGPLLIGVLASVLVLLFVFVGSGRGKTLPPADIVAEEVHRSGIWAAGFLLMLGVFEFIALRIPEVRIPLGLTGLILRRWLRSPGLVFTTALLTLESRFARSDSASARFLKSTFVSICRARGVGWAAMGSGALEKTGPTCGATPGFAYGLSPGTCSLATVSRSD